MTEVAELINYIGLSESDVALKKWLSASGNEKLFLESGDFTAYIERPEKGYCLVFTDEAVFLGEDDKPIGEGDLFLSGAFFYSEGKDGYKQTKDKLPNDVSFDDTQDELANKLGTVEWFRNGDNDQPISQRWDYKNLKFHVTYNMKGTIDIISISKPNRA